MTHDSPTFADRLRAALGLDVQASPRPGAVRTVLAPAAVQQRGQAFAERLRRALERR